MVAATALSTEDYHTGGEPFRIVTGGAPEPEGTDVLARRDWFRANADEVRRLLVNEPRGHADMYGCHVVAPDDDGAHFGAVFFHKDGYSLACGHGTIALGIWAIESGRVIPNAEGETDVVIDVPSGRVTSRVRTRDGNPVSAVFRNVPARVAARGVEVATPVGGAKVDIAWGGAAYVSLNAVDLGLSVSPAQVTRLIEVGRHVKWQLNDHPAAQHPTDDRQSGIYGTIIWEPISAADGRLEQRNVTVFADGQVDRSPCGSGTSARLALLDDEGSIEDDTVLVHHSIVDSVFRGRVVGRADEGVITEIEGTAHRTGHHEFVLEDDDELGTGFQLR